jgi:dipeptidyl aminopeptidase/acylaminoacyl peptidase
MPPVCLTCRLALWSLLASTAAAAVPGPERPLTDPRSLTSAHDPLARPVPVGDLYFSRSIRDAAWSPDGREVVLSTNLTGRFNLWKTATDGAWPVQLVQSDDAQSGAVWSPDGKTIVFQSDHEGGEIFDLYAVPAAGGAVENLTHSDDVSEENPLFSRDGARLAFDRKGKDESATDVALLDLATHEVRKLTHEATRDHGWHAVAFSRDGRSLFATRYDAGFLDASAWRIDIGSGTAEELTPHKGQALFALTAVSPDSHWLALTSNARDGHHEVVLLETFERRYRWVSDTPWEAEAGDFSPDGKQLLYGVNADGRGTLYTYDIAAGRSRALDVPTGVNGFAGNQGSFSADGRRLLVSHQSSTTPGDLWILDTSGGRRQLTRSAVLSLDSAHFPEAQLVHYRSFDGTVISAFVWLPFDLPRDGRAPAVVLPHGGPTGQTRDTFSRTAAALASRGYVLIAPNVRGSTGYGLAFQKANYQDLGGGDLQDEVYAARFLVDTGYVDAKKVGITGGSYGGYMALIALGRTPDVWAAAVDLYGVTDWLTEQAHEEPSLQQYDQSILGDPVKDRAVYERCSATTYYATIRAPLLVLQGENDIRDPKEEAEQAFKALKESGKVVDAHYYPGEGHGFQKRENQIDALERTLAWFDRHLKNPTKSPD